MNEREAGRGPSGARGPPEGGPEDPGSRMGGEHFWMGGMRSIKPHLKVSSSFADSAPESTFLRTYLNAPGGKGRNISILVFKR